MSLTSAISSRPNRGIFAGRRGFDIAKVVVALLFGLAFFLAGQQGRNQARVQARLDDIAMLRGQLEQSLEARSRLAEPLAAGVPFSSSQASAQTNQLPALIDTLKLQIAQFEVDYSRAPLSPTQSRELWLSKVALAIAEMRFIDAVALLKDERPAAQGISTEALAGGEVLQLRGDAYFGLHQWPEALESYRQLLQLKPERLSAFARVVACLDSLGKADDAFATRRDLADRQSRRGDALLLSGAPEAALAYYEMAVAVQSRLFASRQLPELESTLATSQHQCGNAWLVIGQSDRARGFYAQAVDLRTRLAQPGAGPEMVAELAKSHFDLGNAWLDVGKPAQALENYEKASQMLAPLVQGEGHREWGSALAATYQGRGSALLAQHKLDAALEQYNQAIILLSSGESQVVGEEAGVQLAMSCNNRGVAYRAQGNLEKALGDFEHSIKILSPLALIAAKDAPAGAKNAELRRAEVKLDVNIECVDNAIEVLTRSRVVGGSDRHEGAVALAVSLRNRGYASLTRNQVEAAIVDFKRAMEINSILVGQQGQTDLVDQFAKSLVSLAWIYAACPNASFRDGTKAEQYALKACQLSNWNSYAALATLAAAYAESGRYADAVKSQQKAIDLAPAKRQGELLARQELFKGQTPYRWPPPKPE